MLDQLGVKVLGVYPVQGKPGEFALLVEMQDGNRRMMDVDAETAERFAEVLKGEGQKRRDYLYRLCESIASKYKFEHS